MPASEKTWYDQKVMHIIFGVTALVMTIATLWLLAKDHNRQWKSVQLENRKKSAWIIQARHDALADQFSSKLETFDEELREAESEPVDPPDVKSFESLVDAENERLSLPEDNFSKLDAQLKEVNDSATHAAEVHDRQKKESDQADEKLDREVLSAEAATAVARTQLLAIMSGYIKEARRREKTIAGARKFVAADRTAAVSALGLMVNEGASEEEKEKIQQKIDGFSNKIAALTVDLAAAKNYRMSLEEVKAQVDERKTQLLKERSSMETDLNRLAEQDRKHSLPA